MERRRSMDTNNPVIQLCIQGSRAEFEHRIEDAHLLYQQAWEARTDDYRFLSIALFEFGTFA